MLIDNTYFSNWNDIPNLNEPDPNNRVNGLLSDIIQQAEKDVLLLAFGYEMLEDFRKYIKPEGGLADDAPNGYKDIVFGKSYTKEIHGEQKKCIWFGLLEEYPKSSLLADYAYFLFKTHKATQTTEFGEAKVNPKVGRTVSSTPKIVRSWNTFLEKFQGNFIRDADGFTLEGAGYAFVNGGVDYYGVEEHCGRVSFLQYLHDNRSDYPLLNGDSFKMRMKIKNTWSI
ncbi:hypothetical protein GNY06_05060 [Elizabethkingia argentiflava]|uniref:Uncharacterized protein n=1 Tax=Elizabethkingia argenteiflava TaxID=2681556 RepID=A0A845PWF2_9FLAO|nr:hypothetical protein [Elizabethkingia argenteiflava]NAW50777.1 hypothetical protein [Elizabethkingia argenteiflava]